MLKKKKSRDDVLFPPVPTSPAYSDPALNADSHQFTMTTELEESTYHSQTQKTNLWLPKGKGGRGEG